MEKRNSSLMVGSLSNKDALLALIITSLNTVKQLTLQLPFCGIWDTISAQLLAKNDCGKDEKLRIIDTS